MICYTNHTPVLEIKWPKASHGPMAFNLRNYIPNGYSFSETSKCGMRKNRQIIGRGPCAGLNCLSRFPAANCRARFSCVRLTHVYCSSALITKAHLYHWKGHLRPLHRPWLLHVPARDTRERTRRVNDRKGKMPTKLTVNAMPHRQE